MKKTTNRKPDSKIRELGHIIDAYDQELMRYLNYRLRNPNEARDIAQEAYLRFLRVADLDLIEKPQAYLFRIAVNLISEFQMKRSVTQNTLDISELNDNDALSDNGKFEREVDSHESIRELDRILEHLPPLYKTVLLMRKQEGYSHEEIAEKLNISKHSVHRYLKRALAKCRSQWVE